MLLPDLLRPVYTSTKAIQYNAWAQESCETARNRPTRYTSRGPFALVVTPTRIILSDEMPP